MEYGFFLSGDEPHMLPTVGINAELMLNNASLKQFEKKKTSRFQLRGNTCHLTLVQLEVSTFHTQKRSSLTDFVLNPAAEGGRWWSHKHLVVIATVIKTLYFHKSGIWDWKLVCWINIFSLLPATGSYLTF